MNTFKGIKAGDRVAFWVKIGLPLGGKPEMRRCNGKVNPLLIFEDHVVVNHGSCGTVVDESNLIVVYPAKVAA